jgi:DNA-binding MarR family transcriptional regulator
MRMQMQRNDRLESIRRSLVELRRMFQRKELSRLWADASGRTAAPDYTELRLLDAIHACGESGATIGDVALRLGIDPSRASRQVASAVRRGLLARHADTIDARRVLLSVTPRGARMQAMGGELTRARIATALAGWTKDERARFEVLLDRFVRDIVPVETRGAAVPAIPPRRPHATRRET